MPFFFFLAVDLLFKKPHCFSCSVFLILNFAVAFPCPVYHILSSEFPINGNLDLEAWSDSGYLFIYFLDRIIL